MSGAKYMPGPWRIERDTTDLNHRPLLLVTAADGYQMCSVEAPTKAQADASAVLMAAAPEMADALKVALSALCELERSATWEARQIIIARDSAVIRAALTQAGL